MAAFPLPFVGRCSAARAFECLRSLVFRSVICLLSIKSNESKPISWELSKGILEKSQTEVDANEVCWGELTLTVKVELNETFGIERQNERLAFWLTG